MSNQPRHPHEDPALQKMIRSMREFVREGESEHLSEMSKAHHRADLLALASSMSSQTASAAPNNPSPSRWSFSGWQKKRVFAFAAALAVFVLVLNLSLSALPLKRQSSVVRLLVPAAQTAQAFVLQPNQEYPGGIDPASGWTLKASVPTSREAVEKAIRVEPSISLRVEKGSDDNEWRVIPNEPLKDDTVYRVKLAASIQEGDTEVPYEYSWAQQTVGSFRVEGLSPAAGRGFVPADVAIEAAFSRDGFMDPSAYFELKPAVEGRLETRGQTVVFLPNKPLDAGRVYQVRWKAGFGIKDTPSMQLAKDVAYSFQVASESESEDLNAMIYLPNQLQSPVQQEIIVPMNASLSERGEKLRVRLYSVSQDEAVQYFGMRQSGWFWAWSSARRGDVARLAEGKTANFDRELVTSPRYYPNGYVRDAIARLPGQASGFYLASVSRPGATTQGDWTLIQVSDIAVYAQMDESRLVQWVMNTKTAQPVSGASASIDASTAVTNVDGLATLALPDTFRTELAQGVQPKVARVSADGQTTLVVFESYLPWEESLVQKGSARYEGNRNTWVSTSIDRAIQRQTDTLNISGIAADRLTKSAVPNLSLRVVTESFVLFHSGRFAPQAILDEQVLTSDEAGRFSASVSWKDRAVGTYAVQILRDGKVIDSQSFSIRADAKPTIRLNIESDRGNYFAGEAIKARLTATHMDGTPYPNAALEVVMNTSNHSPNEVRQTIKTDDRGMAEVSFSTRSSTPCRLVDANPSGVCYGNTGYTLEARLKEASEGEVIASTYGTIFSSSLQLSAKDIPTPSQYIQAPRADLVNDAIRVTGRTTRLSLSGYDKTSYASLGGVRFDVSLFELMSIQEQTGTTYDPILKKTVPVYSYRTESRRLSTVNVTSNDDGAFDVELAAPHATSSYVVFFTIKDEQGRGANQIVYAYPPYISERSTTPGVPPADGVVREEDPIVVIKNVKTGETDEQGRGITFLTKEALQETVELQAELRYAKPELKRSRPLYILTANGIVDAVTTDQSYRFRMQDQLLPNALVTAVYYTEQGFLERSQSFSVSSEIYQLKVEAKPTTGDPALPGQIVKYRVRVLDKESRPVSNARVTLSLADLALETLGAFWNQTDPVSSLYAWRDTGIVARASTHKLESANVGAEGGGGGDGAIIRMPRKDFKDQAAYVVGKTDAAGMVELEVRLPDNITTWRVETRAISDDLRAGWEVTELAVSKPLAISATIPKTLAVGDAAKLKLMSISADLSKDTTVEYVVDAPTLGMNREAFTAKGYDAVHVPLTVTEAMRGTHQMTVGLRANNLQDAMQFTIKIVDQVPTKTIWEQSDAKNGFRLPETTANRSTVMIVSRARAALLPEVQGMLAWMGDNPRLENMLADRLARAMMSELGVDPETDASAISYVEYQRENGLFAALPYSSESLDTTLEVAFSGLSVGDREQVVKAFQSIAQAKDQVRLQRLKAVAGLVLSDKPALNALQDAAAQSDLTPAEEGVLLRTYAALGMRSETQAIFDRWMSRAEQKDGGLTVKLGSDQESADATRTALFAAYILRDSRREALQIGFDRMRSSASFVPVLDAQILQQRIAQAPNEDVKVVYLLGQQRYERNLNDGSVVLSLQQEEWKQFAIESVMGNAVIQWQRRVPGIPQSTPGMTIQRTHRLLGGTGTPKEGDLVQITLQPRFSSRDTYGCFEVRDRLPANLAPIVSWSPFLGGMSDTSVIRGWSPVQEMDGSVSFVACAGYQDDIVYTARVIGSGTYIAPAPVMQNLESPSLGAVGTPTSFRADER